MHCEYSVNTVWIQSLSNAFCSRGTPTLVYYVTLWNRCCVNKALSLCKFIHNRKFRSFVTPRKKNLFEAVCFSFSRSPFNSSVFPLVSRLPRRRLRRPANPWQDSNSCTNRRWWTSSLDPASMEVTSVVLNSWLIHVLNCNKLLWTHAAED